MMKKYVSLIVISLLSLTVSAQNQYTVDGVSYELTTEVSGTIDLLWNIIDREYRYFVRKNNGLTELVNTRGEDRKFREEYKAVLSSLTKDQNLDTDHVNLTLYSLTEFLNMYNSASDPEYEYISKEAVIESRLMAYGGFTNSPFISNPDNINSGLFGLEFEVFEGNNFPRHALFFDIRHVLKSDNFEYTSTQLALGYRFRIVRKESFSIYSNVIINTFNFFKETITFLDESDQVITEEVSDSEFDTPFSFGLGADVRISPNSFISINYNELFALFLENKGNFSTNVALGYKLNL